MTDIDFLVEQGFVAEDWQSAFDNNASPYYSLPAFIVRAGNPKNIQDWDDLVREDVQVIFPNPKTSGNARYTYLAATAFALEAFDGDQEQVGAFITQIFDNVPVFDTGGRGATTTFVERQLGDVLITFEAETQGIAREFGQENFETVIPRRAFWRNFPSRSSIGSPSGAAPRNWRVPIWGSSIRKRGSGFSPSMATAFMMKPWPLNSRTSSPKSGW